MTTGAIRWLAICSAAAIPSSTGILTSRITRSGRSCSARSTAVAPSPAWPTTSYPSSVSISTRSIRMRTSSSATTTRRVAPLEVSDTGDRLAARRDRLPRHLEPRHLEGIPLHRGQELLDVRPLHAQPGTLGRGCPGVHHRPLVARHRPVPHGSYGDHL